MFFVSFKPRYLYLKIKISRTVNNIINKRLSTILGSCSTSVFLFITLIQNNYSLSS